MKRLLIIIIFLMISTRPFAWWGQNGHRIVAQICYDNLTATAKANVDRILGNNHLAQIATWPDFIRSDTNWNFTKDWHFLTVDTGMTVQMVLNSDGNDPKINNVVEAIELMRSILEKDKEAITTFTGLMKMHNVQPLSGSVELTALAFLVHFIGDINQPLHVGRKADFGGNSIKVLFFSDSSDLHSVWDEGLIEKEELSYSEYAAFIQKQFLPQKKELATNDITKWAEQSVSVREQSIYKNLVNFKNKKTGKIILSYPYQHDNITIIEQQLGAAGFRAAAIINSIFN